MKNDDRKQNAGAVASKDGLDGSGGSRPVPKEIAVCPECGGEIKWYVIKPGDAFCCCLGSKHAPEQTEAMLAKWLAVETTVTAWLKSLPSNACVSHAMADVSK